MVVYDTFGSENNAG